MDFRRLLTLIYLEMDYEVRNNLLESENKLYKAELEARLDKIKELEEENRILKSDVDYRHHRAMVAERGDEPTLENKLYSRLD